MSSKSTDLPEKDTKDTFVDDEKKSGIEKKDTKVDVEKILPIEKLAGLLVEEISKIVSTEGKGVGKRMPVEACSTIFNCPGVFGCGTSFGCDNF